MLKEFFAYLGRAVRKVLRRRGDDPYRLAQERWESSFRWFSERRLPEETTSRYRSYRRRGELVLDLHRSNLFVWVTSQLYRYTDCVVEGALRWDAGNAYSAAGFVLRHNTDDNFYSLLVSDRGYYRFDLVFNGNPVRLIGWTEIPFFSEIPLDEGVEVRVIARGGSFSFFLNDEWIGEVEDETIPAGRVGLCAQNYDQAETARFCLSRLSLESRPVEVERQFLRWTRYVPARPEARARLAETFFSQGHPEAAVVQIRKALRAREGTAEEYMLLAEALISLRLYEPAIEAVERTLQKDPENERAMREKADLLYLLGRMEEAETYLEAILPRFEDSSTMQNLLGNVESTLSRWNEAAQAYERAQSLDPDMPLYRINRGKTLAVLGQTERAVELYLEAARILLRQEAFDELRSLIARIRRTAPENPEARTELEALEAKLLFFEGSGEQAEKALRGLVETGYRSDSSVHYLLGLLCSERGERREALAHYRRAADLEPEVSLYRLRIAETRFLLGEECGEDVEQAHRSAPDDPWTVNLYGQYLMRKGEPDRARGFFERALELAPEEADILVNFSDCLLGLGRGEEAVSVIRRALGKSPGSPRLHNQMGNLLVRRGSYETALEAYERAVELEPENPDYLRNAASTCIELDMILRAEELLGRLLDLHPSPETYNLVAVLALVEGEHRRAEAALDAGLRMRPESVDLRVSRAALLVETRRIAEAKEIVEDVLGFQPENARAAALLARIHREFEQRLACAECGIEWWAPRDLPPQPALQIRGELPDSCPAGRCESCGRVLCVRCGRRNVREGRFVCPVCGGRLRVSGDALKYLVARCVESDGGERERSERGREGGGHDSERIRRGLDLDKD